MNPNSVVEDAKARLLAANKHFAEEIKKLRTGRAHPSMLDGVMVIAYGSAMPLNLLKKQKRSKSPQSQQKL